MVGVLGVSGCAGTHARDTVVQTAAFEHKCAVDKVRIVEENTEIYAYVLDVCGVERRYRDMGNEKEFQFVEVTERPAGTPTAAPVDTPPATPASATPPPTTD